MVNDKKGIFENKDVEPHYWVDEDIKSEVDIPQTIEKEEDKIILTVNRPFIEINKDFNPLKDIKYKAIKESGEDLSYLVKFKDNNVNVDVEGRYSVTLFLEYDEKLVEKKAVVTVLGKPPKITGENYTMNLGEEFNPIRDMKIKAYHDNEGDLTDKVIVKMDNVDLDKVGKYRVAFKVYDSNRHLDSKEFILNVVKPNFEDQIKFQCFDLILPKGVNFIPEEQLVYKAELLGEDITDKVYVVINDVDTSKEGIYKVILGIEGFFKEMSVLVRIVGEDFAK